MSDDGTSNQEVFRAIGDEGGPEALALVASIMESNARASDKLLASLYEGERTAHTQTKQRLHEAETQLAVIHKRFTAMLFDPPSDDEMGYAP